MFLFRVESFPRLCDRFTVEALVFDPLDLATHVGALGVRMMGAASGADFGLVAE